MVLIFHDQNTGLVTAVPFSSITHAFVLMPGDVQERVEHHEKMEVKKVTVEVHFHGEVPTRIFEDGEAVKLIGKLMAMGVVILDKKTESKLLKLKSKK